MNNLDGVTLSPEMMNTLRFWQKDTRSLEDLIETIDDAVSYNLCEIGIQPDDPEATHRVWHQTNNFDQIRKFLHTILRATYQD